MKSEIRLLVILLAAVLAMSCLTGCKDDRIQNGSYGEGKEDKIAANTFRYDNFADGKLSDEFLDTCSYGALAMASECMYFEAKLQEGIKKGHKFVYTNSSKYSPQKGSFDEMLASGKYGTNCAMPAGWAYVDMGILENGLRFYGNTSGGFNGIDKCGKYISAVCTITAWEGRKQFDELFEEGLVKPGDVFLAKGHTFIYIGDDLFMAAGHDGKWHSDSSAQTEDGQHAVFESWLMPRTKCADWTYTIYWQMSFKEDYIPKYYRNAKGKLVENPMYKEETSIGYKEGVSPDDPVIEYPAKKNLVYDTSGRTNVMLGKTIVKANMINIRALDYGVNITDGQLSYDNTIATYSDIRMSGGAEYAITPTYWFNAKGEKSDVKNEEYKYLCAFYADLGETRKVDSFALYSQATGASSGKPFGDVDGFDILVSQDAQNWTVAYSVENAQCEGKYTLLDNAKKSLSGYPMTHFIDGNFNGTYDARYIMYAMTQPRSQQEDKTGNWNYTPATSADYFRITEIEVFEKK